VDILKWKVMYLDAILIFLKHLDTSWFYKINLGLQNSLFDKIMPAASWVGNGGLLWLAFIVLLFLFGNRELKKVSLLMLVSLLGSFLIGEEFLKHLFQRPRPFMSLPGVDLLVMAPHGYSFPSGHASNAFAAGLVLARKVPRLSLPVIALAALIAFSRVYVGVHYPLDVISGVLTGLLCAVLVLRLESRMVFLNSRFDRKI
jgi:undecaprenyl-diphosphatase